MTIDLHAAARDHMITTQIVARGVVDERVIAAMRAVPREEFVRAADRSSAYADGPLAIGDAQTISQPYIVAVMLARLDLTGTERALEVGAGSGYAAAVLGRCVREAWAIERIAALAEDARARLARLGCANVQVLHGDGTRGLAEHAPYDAILVSAGSAEIPPALLAQLAPGGRLVMPVGSVASLGGDEQRLVRVSRDLDGTLRETRLEPVRFVPLVSDG